LPRVPRNVVLHAGYFDASLPKWLDDHPGQVVFIHLDCDLYSSTKTVLALLAPRLASGTVILFDEYFNYPNWEQHEFKAFQEFVSEHKVSYTYLGFARQQVAVRIESIGTEAATSESANGSVKAGSVSPSPHDGFGSIDTVRRSPPGILRVAPRAFWPVTVGRARH